MACLLPYYGHIGMRWVLWAQQRVLILLMKQSASHEETQRSQLNNSRFKQLYSFPRASRFASQQQVPRAPYYDNKISALGNRSTSFGFGNKFTLENRNPVPPPNTYKKQGAFQEAVEKRRGYSFTHEQKKESPALTPGPGKYQCQGDRKDFKRVSYSLRKKLDDPLSRNQNPLGPGHYSTISDFNGKGSYFVAKYPGSGCAKIGNSRRFDKIQTISPGPGNYQDTKVTGFNNSGTYFFSTFRTSKAATFAHSVRKHIADPSATPGPGSYNRFSDFPRNG